MLQENEISFAELDSSVNQTTGTGAIIDKPDSRKVNMKNMHG